MNCECWICQQEDEQDLADGVEIDDCWKCGGSGEVEWDDDACSIKNMTICWVCDGSGLLP